jgi:hypothetical protein
VNDLSYPRFPVRVFLAGGMLAVALAITAIVVPDSGPDVPACAAAAERVMVARTYTVNMMALIGPGPIRQCRGLSASQYAQALADTYRIEYGRSLPRVPVSQGVPPPDYKALSARDQSARATASHARRTRRH